jgi:hypothetical protein
METQTMNTAIAFAACAALMIAGCGGQVDDFNTVRESWFRA